MRRGPTPIVALLKKYGASDAELVKQSIEKSIALLQKSGPEFVRVSGCTSCHHQSLPQMVFGVARERGLAVDAQNSQYQTQAVIAMFKPYHEQMLAGKDNLPDAPVTVSYALLGLAAEGYAPDDITQAMAHVVSTQQKEDGSFRVFGARPPMESSPITSTALSLRAVKLYGKDSEQNVLQAREWLRRAKSQTSEERNLRLLGLVWGKAAVEDIRAAAQEVLDAQRPDGGWAQLSTLESDAYATGQALVALQSSGIVKTSDAALQRGVAFLLRTQRADGSWYVRSRAFPFQPYKESGFPHGKDQWISAAGTSWAAMALGLTLPRTGQEISQVF
jgi:hypothetical protein